MNSRQSTSGQRSSQMKKTEKHLFTSKNRPLLLFCKFLGDENEKKKDFYKMILFRV